MDWILMILNLYSYYLIGNKKSIGFILGLIACILGIMLFYNMISMIVINKKKWNWPIESFDVIKY